MSMSLSERVGEALMLWVLYVNLSTCYQLSASCSCQGQSFVSKFIILDIAGPAVLTPSSLSSSCRVYLSARASFFV